MGPYPRHGWFRYDRYRRSSREYAAPPLSKPCTTLPRADRAAGRRLYSVSQAKLIPLCLARPVRTTKRPTHLSGHVRWDVARSCDAVVDRLSSHKQSCAILPPRCNSAGPSASHDVFAARHVQALSDPWSAGVSAAVIRNTLCTQSFDGSLLSCHANLAVALAPMPPSLSSSTPAEQVARCNYCISHHRSS